MSKLLFKLFFYVILTVTFFYFFEAPFLFETAFAEEITSEETHKNNETTPDKKPDAKTYSNILWEYRWYLIGAAAFFIVGVVIYSVASSSAVPPPPPILPTNAGAMPIVQSQTITDLLKMRPDLLIDVKVSASMPEVLRPDANFQHFPGADVLDPNFIKGFRVGDQIYQIYLMPDNPYAELSKDFWIQEAQKLFGKVTFPTPDTTFLYTQVAVLPLDTINYTVYHKVDIVKIIQDPGHQAIPRILTSYLFKDKEYGWFQ